jgi:hypothetical protein
MSAPLRKRAASALQGPVGSRFVLSPLARLGYWQYRRSDRTPAVAYSAMRKLFGSASAQTFEDLVTKSLNEAPRLDLQPVDGLLAGEVDSVVGALRRDGLVVLQATLSEEVCRELEALAATATCSLTERRDGAPLRARYEPEAPLAVRYDVPEDDLLGCRAVQELLADRSLLSAAQEYLGGAPVQDLVAMWWSTSVGEGPSSAAAQQFHFDLDRLRFVKLFAYLTDVDETTGPHVFVRGSHVRLPAPLRADRRFSDDEVRSHYDASDIISVTGRRGTIFLADTRGLHKGTPVMRGHRLVFQLEYATSLFGVAPETIEVAGPSPALAEVASDYGHTFRRLRLHEVG